MYIVVAINKTVYFININRYIGPKKYIIILK